MRQIILKDGGTGQELMARSSGEPHPLWSAKVLLDEPDIVRDVHREFVEAGARVLTLNSYAATPERLERDGSVDWFEPLQRAAIDLAQEAREQAHCDWAFDVKIAGCLPPLYASYKPHLTPEFEECVERYAAIAAIQAPHVDLMLCETMSSINEGLAAGQAAKAWGKPVWIAFTLSDTTLGVLRSGESLSDALEAVAEIEPDAVLVNCSQPESIGAAMPALTTSGQAFEIGAYANAFSSIDGLDAGGTVASLQARRDLGPRRYADHALGWVDAGCGIVGGCCEIGPRHLAALHRTLLEAGYEAAAPL